VLSFLDFQLKIPARELPTIINVDNGLVRIVNLNIPEFSQSKKKFTKTFGDFAKKLTIGRLNDTFGNRLEMYTRLTHIAQRLLATS
jgi:hypothetical protein